MKRNFRVVPASFFVVLYLAISCGAAADREANSILEQSGVRGGLIVHVGCQDANLTAALGKDPQYVVQGLARDRQKVDEARNAIRDQGLYGRISVRWWSGTQLPFTDNLVNLLIVDDQDGHVPAAEIARVLAPRGVALVPKGTAIDTLDEQSSSTRYKKFTKPVPDEIDDWPHFLHNATNNAVSQDIRVGPPQQMQWVCGPAYARSHEINSSMAGMVSAGGRIFYIWDEGPLGQAEMRFPSQWALIAHDGFNGVSLWKRPMPNWGWRQWHAASRWDDPRARVHAAQLPRTTPRRLVATRDKLFVTLGYEAPVSVLDAATGDVLNTIEGTQGTDEILLDSELLVLVLRDADRPAKTANQDFRLSRNSGRIVAVRPETSEILWQSEPDNIAPLTLACCGGRVIYGTDDSQIVCLDGKNGQQLWQSEAVKGNGTNATLVVHDQVVLYACGPVSHVVEKRDYQSIRYHQAHAFSAETGVLLWSGPQYRGPSGHARDVFVIDGLAWFGVDNQENLPDHWQDTTTQRLGYDPLSGEVKRKVSVPKLTSPGHHYRCYRSKATERFLLLPKRGVEFLDVRGDDHMRHDWLRAPCIYGFLPANGMLYTAPHQCVCYQGVLLSNFTALTAMPEEIKQKVEGAKSRKNDRLVKGPAYDSLDLPMKVHASSDWPMYRHDPRRSGNAGTAVANDPKQQWTVALQTPITPPVVADGRLLIAEKDTHTIQALDAHTGQKLWHYTAGGRIDSPPTVYGPLALFGSADGWVYCLDTSDGSEVWRFRAAPDERQVGAFGQLESAWPVHGSVVVQNDVTVTPPRPLVYFTAGRSTYLDGGIYVYALDPKSGELCYENCLSGPRPDPYKDTGGGGYMDGAKSDILVSDGADLFLHQERLRSDLKRFPAPMQEQARERGGSRKYPTYSERGSNAMRLLSSRGFLDDSYNEGTYWALTQRWPGWDLEHMNQIGAYGQLLVLNEQTVFGVHVFTERIRVRRGFFPGTKGYELFAKAYEPGRSESDYKKTKNDWTVHVPIRVRAMLLADDKLFVAGPPDVIPDDDPTAAFEGRRGGDLWAISAKTGETLTELAHLESPPVYDGLIAADGSLYVATCDGKVHCFGATKKLE